MKARFSKVRVLALVVLASVWAETNKSSTIRPESLARVEAITSYCETVDPHSQSQYLSKLASLMSEHSADEILRDRKTAGYQQAMTQANETFAKASYKTGVRACAELLTEKW